jgi:hypothetical protein
LTLRRAVVNDGFLRNRDVEAMSRIDDVKRTLRIAGWDVAVGRRIPDVQ